ncbi:hypothetical protein FRB90_007006 [Tulasnella sp. 427]|nr:hypothetical protein FRB90_007006 [Tulasnella sp. 427]
MKPPLYLLFAVAQTTAAVLSATILAVNRAKNPTGNIKLPIFSEASADRLYASDGGDGSEELEGGDKVDPFDVSIPLDFLDGTPIDEDRFWEKMHVRKVVQAALLVLLVIFDAISLGWLIIADDSSAEILHIVASSLQLAFSFYILVLSLYTIGETEVEAHWSSLTHIWTMVTLATSLYATRLLLPKALTSAPEAPFTQVFDYASLGLYLVLLAITSFTNRGPEVHFPPDRIYSAKTLSSSAPTVYANVTGYVRESIYSVLLFAYTTPVVMLGYTAESLEIRDLPIVPADMRATPIFTAMRRVYKSIKLPKMWQSKAGTGWELLYKLFTVNWPTFMLQMGLASVTAILYYVPAFFLQSLVHFLEISDAGGKPDASWGWVYCAGLFFSISINYILTGQLWSISTTMLQVRLRVQLNTMLFAKTLVRKDIASAAAPTTAPSTPATTTASTPNQTAPSSPSAAAHSAPLPEEGDNLHVEEAPSAEKDEEEEFSTKAQIMTLMTTDVDRVSEFAWHMFSLVDAPIEIVIGTLFLYRLLGVSSLFGLAVTCLFLPVNHFASKIVIKAQDNLMKSRDERVSLMNEILGGIRMLKFMAWERSFEKRVLAIREKELSYQRRNYYIEVLFNFIWEGSPILVTLVSFWHFAVIRGMPLTPSIAFTSLSVFNELKFALNTLPETFINMLQSLVSVRRIENYLHLQEVTPVSPLHEQAELGIALNNATIAWPQSGKMSASAAPSAAPTPKRKFVLVDLTLEFPKGELSLICGKLGSGKTLLLLSLLGEADLLSGQMICPRSPPDVLAKFAALKYIPAEDWVVAGVCAYVPQTAWLQNASIRENILFNLPFDEERYQKTLEACALISDFKILEDGDASEIGERGVNLSGGQKARVSLARAIYSRASVLFLDDVLSAVDAETAHHIFQNALKGPLMKGRTVILVSHHVQLCVPGAAYVVALNNGQLTYAGSPEGFRSSGVMQSLAQSTDPETKKADEAPTSPVQETIEESLAEPGDSEGSSDSELSSTAAATSTAADSQTLQPPKQKKPRKLVEEEARAVGRIRKDVWAAYITASGGKLFWAITIAVLLVAAGTPVVSNGWLRYWSSVTEHERRDGGHVSKGPLFYLAVYAGLSYAGLVIEIGRWLLRYEGSIRASTVLHKRLLKAVLFANIRFHDTTNRGRLLNRFGKDFETIDSSLADNFGKTTQYGLSAITTIATITYVGGWKFFLAAIVLGVMYFEIGKVYGQTSRDMRRLGITKVQESIYSVTRSPLYTIYGESISGVAVLRAFGAGSKFLREMHQHVDTNTNPYYWMWGVNRWLSIRFNLLSAGVIGLTAIVVIADKRIDASLAGFALAFANTITSDLLFMVRRFVGLEQSMIALERVKEFSELPQEPAEYIEPRPSAAWPHEGAIEVENLVIRYAPELPNVLHGLNFSIKPRSKIGVLGRTGGGKSTLALSFFRFVEATEGKIVIDGVDISTIGLSDLRSRLTIIPQDPTILSGTLRSTLDVFGEYEDHEIYEALRRVHLIPPEGTPVDDPTTVNANTFRNLDSPVAEGGENFSAGEKQLICMARAILKRSKVLFMDEDSTILTIAHRLRTVIDYDKIMLLDQGQLVEFDKPSVLLQNPDSKFYALCKSTGKTEFAILQRMANEAGEKAGSASQA